jgi:hypothetical protein
VGVSPATVEQIWDARGLKPHRVDTFKLSTYQPHKHSDTIALLDNHPRFHLHFTPTSE